MTKYFKRMISFLIIMPIACGLTAQDMPLSCRAPKNNYALRPMALQNERPAATDAVTADSPLQDIAKRNTYGPEKNVNRGFTDLNHLYFGDIREQLLLLFSKFPGRKIDILLIGVGRGFEAFEMMHEYSDRVSITATGKEDMLYRNPKDLVSRFNEYGVYEGIDEKSAASMINRLRENYFTCDLDKGLAVGDDTFDMVIIDTFTLGYVREKYFAISQMLRACRPYGIVFCTPLWGYVEKDNKYISFGEYVSGLKSSHIINLDAGNGNWLKITKHPGLQLPALVKIKSSSRNLGSLDMPPVWDTYYALPTGSVRVLDAASDARSEQLKVLSAASCA
jgi:SAM-dependent methyltransferase